MHLVPHYLSASWSIFPSCHAHFRLFSSSPPFHCLPSSISMDFASDQNWFWALLILAGLVPSKVGIIESRMSGGSTESVQFHAKFNHESSEWPLSDSRFSMCVFLMFSLSTSQVESCQLRIEIWASFKSSQELSPLHSSTTIKPSVKTRLLSQKSHPPTQQKSPHNSSTSALDFSMVVEIPTEEEASAPCFPKFHTHTTDRKQSTTPATSTLKSSQPPARHFSHRPEIWNFPVEDFVEPFHTTQSSEESEVQRIDDEL